MDLSRTHSRTIRKTGIALALGLLAILSYVYSRSAEQVSKQAEVFYSGILTAAAKENASGEPVYQMFLRVDTVQGESTDEKHSGEISVDSFAWGEQRLQSASRPSMDGFRVTMDASIASPDLFLFAAGGSKLARVVLSVRKEGANQDFLKWTLTDTQVVSFRTVGNTHGDGIQDEVTFRFSKIEVEYRQLLPGGTYGSPIRKGWDQRANRPS